MTKSSEPSPTSLHMLQDEIDGANAVYAHEVPAGATPIVSPFLTLLDFNLNGFFALAYEQDGVVFVAFEGTQPDLTVYGLSSLAADFQILTGQWPAALTDAILFTMGVESLAGSTPVYVTGHSLGGAEAEAVALYASRPFDNFSIAGGVTFGAPGLPGYYGATGRGNLTDYVDYGDPVGNYAHESQLGAIAATGNHFGTVNYVGPGSDAIAMVVDFLTGHVNDAFVFHDLSHYAADLGLTIENPGESGAVMTFVSGTAPPVQVVPEPPPPQEGHVEAAIVTHHEAAALHAHHFLI